MIEVTAKEGYRTFTVCVGEKKVGEVKAGAGWANAYDKEGTYLREWGDIRRATRAVLERQGYGRPQSVEVKRTNLGRSE